MQTHAIDTDQKLVSLSRWTREIGVTPVTVWRWRKRGWINPVNICGKFYLSQEAINEFCRRAKAGDFQKPATGFAAIVHSKAGSMQGVEA